MRAKEFISEKRRKKSKKIKYAAYGPGPYGWYGYYSGYSGDGSEVSADGGVNESEINENLRKWFKEKWVRFGPDGKIRGSCAREKSSEGKPKCLPRSKAQSLGKKGRATAAARKRREDPNPERRGPAKNVRTK